MVEENKSARYWEQLRDRYALMSVSLERQLKDINAFSTDWEDCYNLLMSVREKAAEAETCRCRAATTDLKGLIEL